MDLFNLWSCTHLVMSISLKVVGVCFGDKKLLLALTCCILSLNIAVLHPNECNLSRNKQTALTFLPLFKWLG